MVVHAEYIHDYSQDEEFDTSQVDFEVSRNYSPVNHIIALGQGDLADRAVIHIFADEMVAYSRMRQVILRLKIPIISLMNLRRSLLEVLR